MKKYDVFRQLLNFVSTHYTVTDADMNNYCGEIEISGEMYGQKIEITVVLKDVQKEAPEEEVEA